MKRARAEGVTSSRSRDPIDRAIAARLAVATSKPSLWNPTSNQKWRTSYPTGVGRSKRSQSQTNSLASERLMFHGVQSPWRSRTGPLRSLGLTRAATGTPAGPRTNALWRGTRCVPAFAPGTGCSAKGARSVPPDDATSCRMSADGSTLRRPLSGGADADGATSTVIADPFHSPSWISRGTSKLARRRRSPDPQRATLVPDEFPGQVVPPDLRVRQDRPVGTHDLEDRLEVRAELAPDRRSRPRSAAPRGSPEGPSRSDPGSRHPSPAASPRIGRGRSAGPPPSGRPHRPPPSGHVPAATSSR